MISVDVMLISDVRQTSEDDSSKQNCSYCAVLNKWMGIVYRVVHHMFRSQYCYRKGGSLSAVAVMLITMVYIYALIATAMDSCFPSLDHVADE